MKRKAHRNALRNAKITVGICRNGDKKRNVGWNFEANY